VLAIESCKTWSVPPWSLLLPDRRNSAVLLVSDILMSDTWFISISGGTGDCVLFGWPTDLGTNAFQSSWRFRGTHPRGVLEIICLESSTLRVVGVNKGLVGRLSQINDISGWGLNWVSQTVSHDVFASLFDQFRLSVLSSWASFISCCDLSAHQSIRVLSLLPLCCPSLR
jgi:hypothetical protein